MKRSLLVALGPVSLMALAACEPVAGTDGTQAGYAVTVPEDVAAIAAPHQDLRSARILPEDGCYWYSHKGPVETTLLPLLTKSGNPICTRPQS